MINISQEKLLLMLLGALALGIAFGFFYELIRLIRLIVAPQKVGGMSLRGILSNILTFFADLFFILLFAIAAILQTYKISGGVFRGLTYIGMGVGFLFYYFTIGRLTKRLSEKTALFIKKTVCVLSKAVFLPLRKIFFLFFKIYTLTIGKIIDKIRSKIKEKRVLRNTASEIAQTDDPEGEKENKGYKKEGRISFGGQRAV